MSVINHTGCTILQIYLIGLLRLILRGGWRDLSAVLGDGPVEGVVPLQGRRRGRRAWSDQTET